MRLSTSLICSLALVLVSCGSTGPELQETASGTWLSEKIQGEMQQILTASSVQDGEGALDVTVMDLTTHFLPKGEIMVRPDSTGMQIVRIGLRAANIGTQDIRVSHNAFALSLKNGTEGRLSFYINDDNASDFLQTALLEPGASTEGALYYELPEGALREDMLLEYRATERTTALPLIR